MTRLLLVLLSLLMVSAPPLRAVDSVRQLSPYYRHWVEEDVPYIISTDERRAFLALRSDVERENFITAFWNARNPTPNTTFNAYKEEYYRRLSYASEHFGSTRYQDGWRTERGRIYITLGPPSATQTYHLTANIRDLEIWFYQTQTPALPGYFNILFFRPGAGEDYKVYSPRSDGPYRLVTTGQQNNKSAMHVIEQQLGPELSHAALSLIPSEPVDLDSGEPPSMTSDLLLGTIHNLPDNPLEKERITMAKQREKATASVIVPAGPRELEYVVLRDLRGRMMLSYLLRDHTPNPALVGKRKDGTQGYSLALRTSVMTPEGKLIYEQQNALEGVLTEQQAAVARTRDFAVEDRVPVLPGKYLLEVSVRNNLTGLATISRESVTVNELTTGAVSVSPLVVTGAAGPVRDASFALPFSFAGLRFAPKSVGVATIHVGDRLPLVFQLHLPPATAAQPRPATIHLHYLFGSVTTAGVPPTESDEEVDTNSADPAGNIVSGHTLPTFDLVAGTYRVVVRATGPNGMASGSSGLQLNVVPVSQPIELWTAYGPEPREATQNDDVKRGMIAAAQGHPDQAVTWYQASLREYPESTRSLQQLVLALSALNSAQQLAALADQAQFAHATSPETVLLVAGALDATGATPRAISLVNSQMALQTPNADLLNGLATYYQHAGNAGRAQEYRDKARELLHR